ncbi:hypothetical protein TRAPUB_8907 [Trametes pubescens]|uniref:Uncharacterized protein n=1 Tax=Trametes pubescens TaxID=154538 RepID=A0A1M2W3U4_TRAPU|nr:hypothetical protein TRAPUB_8907 [Trametes pubescens]
MLHTSVRATGNIDVDQGTWDALYQSSGAVLIGGLVALFLSGAVLMQVVIYWQMYPNDPKKMKAMVRTLGITTELVYGVDGLALRLL